MLTALYGHGQSVLLNCTFESGNSNCDFTPDFNSYSELLTEVSFWNTCAKPVNQLGGGTNFFGYQYRRTSPDYLSAQCANADRVWGAGSDTRRIPTGTAANNKFGHIIASNIWDWYEGFIFNLKAPLKNSDWVYYELKFKAAYSDTNWSFQNSTPYYNPTTKPHKFKVSFSEWDEHWWKKR